MIQFWRVYSGNADMRTFYDNCVPIDDPALTSENAVIRWLGRQVDHDDRRSG